jgi:hypothetical protein
MTARYRVFDPRLGEEIEQTYWSKGEGIEAPPTWLYDWATTYRTVELAKIVGIQQDGQVVEIELNERFHDVEIPAEAGFSV